MSAPPAHVICLVGMSNVGKSHWAQRLADEAGYEVMDCDLELARVLFPGAPDVSAAHELAAWLGQPGDPGYAAASTHLLMVERMVMQTVLARLRGRVAPALQPLVIDTGGSVIHAGEDVLDGLRELTRVVYLEAAPERAGAMYARYLRQPKALIWADAWQPLPGEPVMAARERCYPALLASRARRYAGLAHVTLPAALHERPDAPLSLLTNTESAAG